MIINIEKMEESGNHGTGKKRVRQSDDNSPKIDEPATKRQKIEEEEAKSSLNN